MEWREIANQLEKLNYNSFSQRSFLPAGSSSSSTPVGHAVAAATARPPVPPAAEDPARAQFRLRVAHLVRGLILIFALGMPRIFYYGFGGYAIVVLSGALDYFQSAQFRQYFTGARPTLDIQLARLRQRKEYIEKLSEVTADDDSEATTKMREFLQTFKEERSYASRFFYQLVVMLFYSALPSCHPHGEFLT